MKHFEPHVFDADKCRKDVEALKQFLAGSPALKEHQLLSFFSARRHLCAALGFLNRWNAHADLLAWEYDLFGDFACDLAIGDSATTAYCFIEFEDAGPKSLFVQRAKKAMREWSSRIEHRCSQVIDWFHKLEDRRNSEEYEARFGKRSVEYCGAVLVGRDQHLKPGEADRLAWRRQHVIVHSRNIFCITYDELLRYLTTFLERYPTPAGS
jgi:hypothetical protein